MTADASQPAIDFRARPTLAMLALVFGTAAFATDMYLPAFPSIRQALGTDPASVQLSLSVFLYGTAAGNLAFGPLSDRYGRRPVLLVGLVLYTLASAGCATARTIDDLLAFRVLQGAAAASGPVLVRALVNDVLDRDHAAQMLALLTGLMALAAMATPAIGGFIVQKFGWPVIFHALALTGLVLCVAAGLRLPETLHESRRLRALNASAVITGYIEIASNRAFWRYVLPPVCMFSGVFAYAAVNSFLLIDELGFDERTQGLLYSAAAAAYVSGSLASRWLTRAAGTERAMSLGVTAGLAIAAVALGASSILPLSAGLVVVPALLSFFATALILPIGFSIAVSLFPQRGGSASAVAGCTQLVLAGASTASATWWYDATTLGLHALTFACCIAAAVLWFTAAHTRVT